MALMEDERLILRWLSQYGPLRWPQIRGLLYYRPQRSVNRLVQNMKHARRIAAIEDGEYLAVDQYCEPKQRMITAVWVLLQFIEQIAPEAHWQADAPAQISFLKDKQLTKSWFCMKTRTIWFDFFSLKRIQSTFSLSRIWNLRIN